MSSKQTPNSPEKQHKKRNSIIVLTKKSDCNDNSLYKVSSKLVLKENDKSYSLQINNDEFLKPKRLQKNINKIKIQPGTY